MWEGPFTFSHYGSFLPKLIKQNIIMRKTSNSNWGTFYKICDQYSSKLSRSSETRKSDKPSRGTYRDMGSWIGKGDLVVKTKGIWIKYGLSASLVAQLVKNLPAMQDTQVQSLGQEDPLEKEMATHSRLLAWRIPLTEETGGLQSMESQSQTWLCN